jgi:hypothetical protein
MRIFLLLLSLFVAQNTVTSGIMTNAMKLTAAGIALTAGSGVITELLYPTSIPEDPSKDYGAGDPLIGMGIGIFNVGMAFYIAFYNSKYGLPHKYAPFCILFASVYGHLGAANATRYIKNRFKA